VRWSRASRETFGGTADLFGILILPAWTVGASPATALTVTDHDRMTIYLAPAERVGPGGSYDDGTSATRATYSGKRLV
jgi:hypothetical protein